MYQTDYVIVLAPLSCRNWRLLSRVKPFRFSSTSVSRWRGIDFSNCVRADAAIELQLCYPLPYVHGARIFRRTAFVLWELLREFVNYSGPLQFCVSPIQDDFQLRSLQAYNVRWSSFLRQDFVVPRIAKNWYRKCKVCELSSLCSRSLKFRGYLPLSGHLTPWILLRRKRSRKVRYCCYCLLSHAAFFFTTCYCL